MTRRLSAQQRALVIGTILGDGCLIANRKNTSARLQIRHQQKHFEYVRWKYELLKPLVKTPPKIDVHNNSEFFRTIHHQDLGALRTIFYPSGKKNRSKLYCSRTNSSNEFGSLVSRRRQWILALSRIEDKFILFSKKGQ